MALKKTVTTEREVLDRLASIESLLVKIANNTNPPHVHNITIEQKD